MVSPLRARHSLNNAACMIALELAPGKPFLRPIDFGVGKRKTAAPLSNISEVVADKSRERRPLGNSHVKPSTAPSTSKARLPRLSLTHRSGETSWSPYSKK